MKNLLWIGDACCQSGFAKATHSTLDTLRHHFNVTVLGINYRGDPSPYSSLYPIYTAHTGGDYGGVGRLIWMCDVVKPDVIVIQNDGWNIQSYVQKLHAKDAAGEWVFGGYAEIPIVIICAVDGKNFQGQWLNGVSHTIFWTQFAFDEARAGGYQGGASVIPLGVDLTMFYPEDKKDARLVQGLPAMMDDAFIVGDVNRNQPRKRWDLLVKFFAEWAKDKPDAYLYLHTAPTGDMGTDVKQLVKYYGLLNRCVLVIPEPLHGVSEETMRNTYNCFDVYASTTQGEGMGLGALEAMACKVACVLSDWSAYSDWAKGAARLVRCSGTAIGPPYVNVIGGVVDERHFTNALDVLYKDSELRRDIAARGFARVNEPRFRWEHIGQQFIEVLDAVTQDKMVVV
jgi:D-inositol-3-phosphate glycosyltransferase